MANKYREITTEEPEVIEQEVVVEETTDSKPEKPSKPRKKGVLGKGLSAIFSGTFLTNDKTLRHLPFIIFLAFIAILYIANGYYADDKIREVKEPVVPPIKIKVDSTQLYKAGN